jgi:hypothetical protein
MPTGSVRPSPVDEGDHWLLPVGEGIVTQLQIDFAFGFTVEQSLHFRIEQPFVVERAPSDSADYDPEASGSVAPLVDLHQAVVTKAAVYKDGRLVVRFGDGRVLAVRPSEQYEAFSITGSGPGQEQFRLVSLPGGGLAEWVRGDPAT